MKRTSISAFLLQNHLIIFVLLVATSLRFWAFWDLPFQHDELSALLRSQVDSWQGFIETGVKRDNHPAGTQLLIWLQTMIGGYSPWWIKFPFLLAGSWSVWLGYIVAKKVTGPQPAIVSAGLMATLQFHLMYSQWARPYIIGLCAVLLVAWALLRIRTSESKILAPTIVLCLGLVVTAYTHYFALLQSILLVAIGVIGLNKKSLLLIGAVSLAAFILFIPHISITLHHLSRGGIGEWLHAPEGDYWFDVLSYMFQFSWLPAVLILLLSLRGLTDLRQWKSPTRLALLVLAILPYLIAYIYSVMVNPLLHQGVLFFSLPFFLMLICSFIHVKQAYLSAALVILIGINVNVLIADRHHYSVNYQSEYGTTLDWFEQLKEADVQASILLDIRKDFTELYQQWGILQNEELVYADELYENRNLAAYLDDQTNDYFFFAMTNATRPELLAAVLDYFPCIEQVRYYNAGAAYLLSRKCDSRRQLNERNVLDEYLYQNTTPFSTNIDWGIIDLPIDSNLHFVAEVRGVIRNSAIVISATGEGVDDYWRGVEFQDYLSGEKGLQKGYQALYVSELDTNYDHVKSYIWLNESSGLHVISYKAYLVPSNPVKGGLYIDMKTD